MPATYQLKQLLSAFESAYGCIDVRGAFIKENDHWNIAALSIHFRVISKSAAIAEFKNTQKRFGRLRADTLRIIQECLPVENIDVLRTMLDERRLRLGDVECSFETRFDLFERSNAVFQMTETQLIHGRAQKIFNRLATIRTFIAFLPMTQTYVAPPNLLVMGARNRLFLLF